MASSLNLFVIGTVILTVAHGASLATTSGNGKCGVSDYFEAVGCIARINDYAWKLQELDVETKGEAKEYKRSCDLLKRCFSGRNGGCKEVYSNVTEVAKIVQSHCEALNYITRVFAACADKLETNNSTCFAEWEPFPANVAEEEDEKKKFELAKEACKNFFGKENCLKKEITETCSREEWIGFRKYFISLGPLTMQCAEAVHTI